MIIVGTTISDTKIKVDGCFTDESQSIVIAATTPPNPITNQVGKNNVLFLNPVTEELFWGYEDRPLTETEILQADQALQLTRLSQIETDNLDFQNYVLETLGGM
ncbi:MAG TPA: hypothetical protein VIK78_03290 [Ruminiclostridium sp.]